MVFHRRRTRSFEHPIQFSNTQIARSFETVIASAAKQPIFLLQPWNLRGACHRARIRATRVRDDRDTPLCGVGRLESIKLFLPNGEAKYFLDRGWTLICPAGCFAAFLRIKALLSSVIDLHPRCSRIW
jgi:hypothetical protein